MSCNRYAAPAKLPIWQMSRNKTLEPPEDGDMEMNSAPETGAERDAHSAEPAPATPGDAPTPPARSKPRPISRDEFLAQLQEFNEHA